MTRMVSQILWEHCMGDLGYWGNDYENDTFAVRSYDWVDEDNNEWHFWHKPSGLKVQWYKYPLRGFEANIDITDDQFLDVLRDCTNSMEDGEAVRFLHDIRRWWADRKTENSSEKPNNSTKATISKMEQVDKDINVRSKDEPQTDCETCRYAGGCDWEPWQECPYTPKNEPQTETEIAKAIVHKMIDDAVIAEDAYPDLRQKMHDAVDEYEPLTGTDLKEVCREEDDEFTDRLIEEQLANKLLTDCAWK